LHVSKDTGAIQWVATIPAVLTIYGKCMLPDNKGGVILSVEEGDQVIYLSYGGIHQWSFETQQVSRHKMKTFGIANDGGDGYILTGYYHVQYASPGWTGRYTSQMFVMHLRDVRPPSPPTSLLQGLPPSTPASPGSPPSGSPAVAYTISFTITAAGTVDAFDKSAFKAKLAAQLDGISPADITVNVTAASIRVGTIIQTRSEAIANASLDQLQMLTSSIDTLSDTLGLVVEAVVLPPSMQTQLKSNASRSSSSVGLIAGVIGAAAILLILIFMALITCHFRKKRAETSQRPVVATPIEMASVDVHSQTTAAFERQDRQHSSAGVAIGQADENI